jgi:anti-anti-sigma regulatory factor
MSATFKQSGNSGVLTLEGELTLPHAEELRKALLSAILAAADVSIGFGSVQEVDVSCLQLVCSAHRSAFRLKKRVSLGGSLPPVVKEAAEAAGYARLKGCKRDCDKSCIWMAAGLGGEHDEGPEL